MIRQLDDVSADQLARIITGYTSEAAYTVRKSETPERTLFTLELIALETPRTKHYHAIDNETVTRYKGVLAQGLSFGAYQGDALVGLAIAERHDWNNSLWVWEFHVAESHRGQGTGTRLMEALVDAAKQAGVRVVICETQSANVPAIRFYRRMGFELDGVDLSYYTNHDVESGEVAVFMKRWLGSGRPGRSPLPGCERGRSLARLLDQIIVIDIECTCWKGNPPPDEESEIIEVGICTLDVASWRRGLKRSVLVRPTQSRVSAFCTQLTTLTQAQVDTGVSFSRVCSLLQDEYRSSERVWASYGDYDRSQFVRQCYASGIVYPFGASHLNIKTLFALIYKLRHEVGMAQALDLLKLPLEGTHHRGGDDAWNAAAILARVLNRM